MPRMAVIEEYAQMVDMVLTTGASFVIDRSCFQGFQQALRICGIVEFRIVGGQFDTLIIAINEPNYIVDKIEEVFEQIIFGKTIEYGEGV